jgi:hypothetical protein
MECLVQYHPQTITVTVCEEHVSQWLKILHIGYFINKKKYIHVCMPFMLYISGQLSGIMASQPSTREYYSRHVCSPRDENYTSCIPHEK